MKPFGILIALLLANQLSVWSQKEFKVFYYTNGQKSSEGYLEQGKPNGYWKNYYDSGILKSEGNRKDYQLDSTWKFFRVDGSLQQSIEYKENLKEGFECLYDSLGRKERAITFKSDIKDGPAYEYFSSGKLSASYNYTNNLIEGKYFEYAEDTRIITRRTYKNGLIYSEEKINRYNRNNQRVGLWIELRENGKLKEEGNYQLGLKEGTFKVYNKQGEFLKFEFYENGILKENTEETEFVRIEKFYDEKGRVIERGGRKNGLKHGTFQTLDSTGNIIFSRLYLNDIMQAEGKYDSLNREIGEWKYYFPNGKVRCVGSYSNGKKNGDWKYYFENGRVEQLGKYDNNFISGKWLWYYSNGIVLREESYRKGKLDGHYVENDSLGVVVLEGDYGDGLKQGKWYRSINDHKEEGEYVDDERNGLWVFTHSNGIKMFEGKFELGAPVGKHEYFYSNGKNEMKGEYEGGELEGDWMYFDEDGIYINTVTYQEGKLYKVDGIKLKEKK
jgi:antitoxin component YwqK of YwqJK toxin-antitoxin module